MKNFILGAIAMLVLMAGGYWLMQYMAEREEPKPAAPQGEMVANVAVARYAPADGEGPGGGSLVFIVGENAVAKTLEAAEEAEAAAEIVQMNATSDSDPRPGPTTTSAPTSPATASPEEPPQRGVCVGGPYVVFFDRDNASVNASAAATLNRVAQHYRLNCPGSNVSIMGHTDEGSRSYAVGLSQRMASAVGQYLGSRGVPGNTMSIEGYGRSQLRVQAVEGMSDPQNRRVEIVFGG